MTEQAKIQINTATDRLNSALCWTALAGFCAATTVIVKDPMAYGTVGVSCVIGALYWVLKGEKKYFREEIKGTRNKNNKGLGQSRRQRRREMQEYIAAFAKTLNVPAPGLLISLRPKMQACARQSAKGKRHIHIPNKYWEKHTIEEIKSIAAHEMGHVVVSNIGQKVFYSTSCTMGALLLANSFCAASRFVCDLYQASEPSQQNITALSTPSSFTTVFVPISGLLGMRCANLLWGAYSRMRERQADRIGGELEESPHLLSQALKGKLSWKERHQIDMEDPEISSLAKIHGYLFRKVKTHPSIPERCARLEKIARKKERSGNGLTPTPSP